MIIMTRRVPLAIQLRVGLETSLCPTLVAQAVGSDLGSSCGCGGD